MRKKRSLLFICIAGMLALTGCAPQQVSLTTFALGTVCTQTGYTQESILEEGEQLLYDQEAKWSWRRENSETAKINESAGQPVRVDEETIALLSLAKEIAVQSDGAFDPTLGLVTQLWDITGEDPKVPAEKSIQELLDSAGYEQLQIDEKNGTVSIGEGQALDLGGIAKGWAADRLAEQYRQSGVKSAILNLGGNIYVLGEKPDGEKYRVGLRDPAGENATDIMATLAVMDAAVVVSGAYERYFEENGKRYHHILDSSTGYPAESGLLSVCVISEQSALADALTTAIFVMGEEKGLALARKMGVDALLVTERGAIVTTPDFLQKYEVEIEEEKGYYVEES